MADAAVRVLVIDDDRDDFLILQGLTRDSSLRLDHIDNYADGLTAIARREHDVYLVDFRIGSENGIELMTAALHAGCDAPIILLTGSTDPEVDRGAMLAGAADFLAKGRIDGPLLQRTIRYAVERKRHEKELRAMTAHAEAASRIKGDFLARMSHEIRTPMNAILGMTEVVLETELTALQREFLESVRMASQSLRAQGL
jgi:DNA-binding NtrC family response regulator